MKNVKITEIKVGQYFITTYSYPFHNSPPAINPPRFLYVLPNPSNFTLELASVMRIKIYTLNAQHMGIG